MSSENEDALVIATAESNIEAMRALLDSAPAQHWSGNALLKAAYFWNTEATRLLLDRGIDPNANIEQFGYPLQAASYYGCPEQVQLLLERGANVNAIGGEFGTALQAAAFYSNNHVEEMELLRTVPAEDSATSYRHGWGMEGGTGHTDVMTILLDHGADINASGGKFGSALQAAVYHGNRATIQFLLDRGADTDSTGGKFGSPMRAAMVRGDIGLQQLLLERGAQGCDFATRQAADGECMLCNMPLGDPCTGDQSHLVWCKSACGRNLHRQCMAMRSIDANDRHLDLTCPGCSAYWWYC